MTAIEFTSPTLTAEQWQHINALATSLQPDQALSIGGELSLWHPGCWNGCIGCAGPLLTWRSASRSEYRRA